MLIPLLVLLALPILAVLGFAAWLTLRQTTFILPGRVNSFNAADIKSPYEHLTLTTPDGTILQGVLFPAQSTTTTLILAFPGNTHNAVGFASFLKSNVFLDTTTAVAALSYRGYPNGVTPPSTGKPSQKAMFADSEFIYDHLTEKLKPTSIKIVAYSIGTSVAVHLALCRPVVAMALMAPLASIRRIVQEKYPWLPVSLLLRHPFASEDSIAKLTIPTTLIYTPTDELVPPHHVEDVLHTANPNLPVIKLEGHNHTSLIRDPRIPGLIRAALDY